MRGLHLQLPSDDRNGAQRGRSGLHAGERDVVRGGERQVDAFPDRFPRGAGHAPGRGHRDPRRRRRHARGPDQAAAENPRFRPRRPVSDPAYRAPDRGRQAWRRRDPGAGLRRLGHRGQNLRDPVRDRKGSDQAGRRHPDRCGARGRPPLAGRDLLFRRGQDRRPARIHAVVRPVRERRVGQPQARLRQVRPARAPAQARDPAEFGLRNRLMRPDFAGAGRKASPRCTAPGPNFSRKAAIAASRKRSRAPSPASRSSSSALSAGAKSVAATPSRR